MRLFTEKRLKVSIAGTLASVALILMIRLIAVSDMPSAAAMSVSHGGGRIHKASVTQEESTLSILRKNQLKISEGKGYEGTGRNIFRPEVSLSPRPPRRKPSPPAPEKQS